ncbi:hypothetical protein [Paenibacillus sp. NPDC058071]|uniref:hypothetical protein n=1 Tax=Paenibacillus sp. NPDC058071 TaxID=3346326 RepID=UPI0036DBF4F6
MPEDGFQAFLERKYIEIRKSGLDDIATVAKNTGLTEEQILKMKRHLFLDTKQLSVRGKPYEELYFQADPVIAHAWQKAQKGELNDAEKEWFRKLANHEIKEKEYMDGGMPLRDSSTWNAEKDTFDVVPEKNELIDYLISQKHKDLKHLDELLIIQVTRGYWRFD